jgi:hypothetical protein
MGSPGRGDRPADRDERSRADPTASPPAAGEDSRPLGQRSPAADPPARAARIYVGQHTRTARDWIVQGWKLDHAFQLAASAHRAGEVLVIDDSGVTPLRHYPYHSPSGFAWGHSGGGPADLARCILLDHYAVVPVCSGSLYRPVPRELPVRYQDFRYDVISRLPRGLDWTITGDEIDAWAHGMGCGPG